MTSKRTRWAGHVEHPVGKKKAYRILVENLKEKRPFTRPRQRWENINKMDLKEVR